MNTQEVIAKLNKYKEMLEQETDTDVRGRYASKISQLEASLKEAEEKVEKLEEKVQSEEKKELSEAEKKINKYKEFLDGESDPDVKARYQKKIKELQDSLKEVKEEIKEEKKEVAEQKVEIKKAIKAVKSVKATKVEKKEAIQKVEKKVRERKEVSVKRTRRSKKIKQIISDLDKLIERNKKLKQKYTGKNVDVERDASRAAKPFGYRFVGKHDYRVPTKAQIKSGKASGKVVYEGRPNRSDVFPKGQKGKSYAKLAKGGQINMDKHIWEGWTVGSFIEELDLDFRYHPKFKSRDEVKKWAMENQPYYKKYIPEVVDYYWEKNEQKYAKGGKTPIIRTQFEEEEFEYAYGGEIKVGDKVKAKNAKYHATVTEIVDDVEVPYAKITYSDGIVKKADLKNLQKVTLGIAPEYVNTEYMDKMREEWNAKHKMAKGGKVGHTQEDKVRFAKPAGWRWKNTAVKKKIINQAQLSKSPTKAMREKYPNYVYFEDRLNKADKNPSRKYLSE